MTQIIERVARAIYQRRKQYAPWEPPWVQLSQSDRDEYIADAQAALKEIKLDELVGALRASPRLVSLGIKSAQAKRDKDAMAYALEATEIMNANAALLSELEKTE